MKGLFLLVIAVVGGASALAQGVARSGAPTRSVTREVPGCPPVPTPPVLGVEVIGQAQGGFSGGLAPGDAFGSDVAPLGDFDGDCIPDLAVVATGEDEGTPNAGAIFLLFMRADGSVREHREISTTSGGFIGPLLNDETFYSVTSLGDLDRDGVTDLFVGARTVLWNYWEQPASSCWVLFLNPNGSVKREVKITEGPEGTQYGSFGHAVTTLGDLDDDGVVDVAVSSLSGLWIYFLRSDGTVRDEQFLTIGTGGFPPAEELDIPKFAALWKLGCDLDALGDFDGDGVEDLLLGSDCFVFEGQSGHLALVFLNPDGTVKEVLDYSSYTLGIYPLDHPDPWYADGRFAAGVSVLGDLDGDGVTEIGVGSPDPHGCHDTPLVWILHMNGDGTVGSIGQLESGPGPHALSLEPSELFGWSLCVPGDLNGDGRNDLVVGAPQAYGGLFHGCQPTRPEGLVYVLGDVTSLP